MECASLPLTFKHREKSCDGYRELDTGDSQTILQGHGHLLIFWM